MGGGFGHYNAFQKQRLGWLDYNVSPPITTVSSSGAYTLDTYEMPGTAPKALKIARGTTGQSFFVELRRPVGWDANLYRTGVFIHLATDNQPDSSSLLDMTPGTAPSPMTRSWTWAKASRIRPRASPSRRWRSAAPARHAFFKLSCEASGSTLTLRINGVTKVSTSAGTFSTGSAGFAISTQNAISHRADNFSATAE